MDLNGEPCALVKVEFPFDDVVFEGNIVGSIIRHVNEYWVYMTAGSRFLEIKHPKLYTLEVSFSDYNISVLEGFQTYKIVVSAPLAITQETKTNNERTQTTNSSTSTINEPEVHETSLLNREEKPKKRQSNMENGHEFVDLGLPSGTEQNRIDNNNIHFIINTRYCMCNQ